MTDPRVLTQQSDGESEINSDTSAQYLKKLQEHEANIQFYQPWWWSTNIYVHWNQTTCNTILNELLYMRNIWRQTLTNNKCTLHICQQYFTTYGNELHIMKCNENCHAHKRTQWNYPTTLNCYKLVSCIIKGTEDYIFARDVSFNITGKLIKYIQNHKNKIKLKQFFQHRRRWYHATATKTTREKQLSSVRSWCSGHNNKINQINTNSFLSIAKCGNSTKWNGRNKCR